MIILSVHSTFFRRPGFSPDGKLLAYPCGCYEVEDDDNPSTDGEDVMAQINVVYVFHHLNLERFVFSNYWLLTTTDYY